MRDNDYLGSLSEPLKTFVFVAKGIIPKQLCQHVIQKEKTVDNSWSKHQWTGYEDKKLKTSVSEKDEDGFIVKNFLNVDLDNCIKKSVELYTQVYKVPGMVRFFSDTRINRYLSGTEMKSHYDHIFSIFDGEKKGIPILSIVGLLNNDFDGGEFHFYDSVVPLEAGDILVFPSCFLYPHGVKKVTKGERWSFVSWVH